MDKIIEFSIGKTAVREYNSAAELVAKSSSYDDFAIKNQRPAHWCGYRWDLFKSTHHHGETLDSWAFGTGVTSLSEHERDVKYGIINKSYLDVFQKEMKNIQVNLDNIEIRKSIKKRIREYSYNGDPDLMRYFSGIPEMYFIAKRQPVRKVVKIAIGYAMTYDNDSVEFARVCARAIKIINLLSECGISVEVIGVNYSHNVYRECSTCSDRISGLRHSLTLLKLKNAEYPLDIQRLGTPSYSSMLRYYGFKEEIISGCCGSGMGTSPVPTEEILKYIGCDIYVGKNWDSGVQKAIIKKLNLIINEQGE